MQESIVMLPPTQLNCLENYTSVARELRRLTRIVQRLKKIYIRSRSRKSRTRPPPTLTLAYKIVLLILYCDNNTNTK